jgi:hypothetical protein
MANEYMKSNDTAAGLVIPVKTRSAATDKSSVTSDYKSQPGPGTAPMSAPRQGGGTSNGPATIIQGVYTQPSGGRKI